MTIHNVATPEGERLTVQECEVCLGTDLIIKSRNHPELPECPRCERTACMKCFASVEITVENHEIFKKHIFSQRCVVELCSECIDEVEMEYLEDLKVDDLPLYVSHHWESEAAADRYKERLQE